MKLETRHSISEILSRQPLFRGLSPSELEAIAQYTQEFKVEKNELLFQRGELPQGLHVLVMGQVKLFIPSAQGTEKIVHMLGPGATFGEAVLFLDRPYPVTAEALEPCYVLVINKDHLLPAIEQTPMLARKMLAGMSMRLHELMTDIESCTLRSSSQRVVGYLLQQAPDPNEREYALTLGTSKQALASKLNLAPETLSRVFSQLNQQGLIQVKGRDITVLDRAKLLESLN